MILFPAIDLKDGQCVRLEEGDMARATTFNESPAAQAATFESQGFEWLHIVDLNGAFAGKPVNGDAVDSILGAISLPVQLGGGIRNMNTIEDWLQRGVRRVILGTAAVRDPDLVHAACRAFPGQVAVGLDARGAHVAVEGWAEATELTVLELARRFEGAGVAAIIYTDIGRDGLLSGLNVMATVALAEAVSVPVIASGGVASIKDIARLIRAKCPGIEGVISGRAIYDGRLDITEAFALIHGMRARGEGDA